MTHRHALVLSLASLLAGCTGAADDAPKDDTDTIETDMETDVVPECGNEVVEGDEACDDGDNDGGEGECLDCEGLQVCGDDVAEGTEQCDDGNTEPGDGCDDACQAEGPVESVTVNVGCSIGGAEPLQVPVRITVAAGSPLTVGGAVRVNAQVVSTITPEIGALVLITNVDTVTVSSMTFGLTVVGADTATLSVTTDRTPFEMDVDSDDDLMADAYDLVSDNVSADLMLDGSSEVTFALASLDVGLTEVPLLETLDLVVPAPGGKALVQCSLPEPNTPVRFAVPTPE